MISNIKTIFGNMFGKNSKIYDKPLNKLSILLVVAFDIFLFYNLLSGYTYQKELVVSPYEKYSCVTFFQSDKNNLLEQINYYYSNDTIVKIDLDGNKKTINYDGYDCTDLYKKVIDIKNSSSYITYINKNTDYQNNLNNLTSQKYDYENQYRDFLEESKSGINNENSRLSDIDKENAKKNYNNIKENISLQQSNIDKNIKDFVENNNDFKDLNNYIEKNKENFLKNYDKEVFWYPVKITFYQAFLLLPLFLISLFFYKFFLKRQNKIYTILFSNLTFITGIFVFVLFLKVVYFIIPHKFFAGVIALLKSLSLGFLWNYILVIIGIGVFGFVIYMSQKGFEKLEKIKEEQEKLRIEQNKKKVQIERFSKGLCIDCNSKLLPDSRYCQFCGKDQFYKCNNCENLIPKVFEYCNKCGEKN